MATVEVILSHRKDPRKKLPLVIEVRDTSIAQRWLEALQELLENNFFLKKDFCFMGFPDAPEGIGFWLRKLKKYCGEISAYSRPTGVWKEGYKIPFPYTVKDVFHEGQYHPGPMWAVHHDFELLIGQRWAMSPYFLEAERRIKHCIIQVNDVVHQIEWLGRSMQQRAKNPEAVSPFTMFSFLITPLFPFQKSDRKFFQVDEGKIGSVYLKYAQMGKNHWESFVEGDTEIFKSNVNGLKAFTGQFTIDWGPGMSPAELKVKKREFRAWLEKNGWDPDDPELALGRVKVGEVRLAPFKGMKLPEIHLLLANFSNVEKITVKRETGSVSQTYPLQFTDPRYERMLSFRCPGDFLLSARISAARGEFWTPRPDSEHPAPEVLAHG